MQNAPEAAMTDKVPNNGGISQQNTPQPNIVQGESPQYTAYKAASRQVDSIDEIKKKVKDDILSDEPLLNSPEAVDTYTNKLKEKYSQADIDEVKRYAQKISSVSPEYKQLTKYVNGEKPKAIASFSMETGEYKTPEENQEILDKETETAKNDRDAHVKLANLALQADNPKQAIALYDKALTLKQKKGAVPTQQTVSVGGQQVPSEDTDILYGIGVAQQQLGNDRQAEISYNDALENDPKNSYAQRGLASLKWKQGDITAAHDLINQASINSVPQQELEQMGQQYRTEEATKNDTRDYLNGIADGLTRMVTGTTGVGAIEAGFNGEDLKH